MPTPKKNTGTRKKNVTSDLPGSQAQVLQTVGEENSYPTGRQYADNPSVHPAFHNSPDNKPEKRTHPSEIVGWGADLDVKNRPAYPMERTPPRNVDISWTEPERQVPRVKIFHSVERPGITPVFGTSTPPKGLSGIIRQMAYNMSENDVRRWLVLLAADRINVVEGVLDDLSRGHVPNIFKEMGLPAELKYNRPAFVKRVAKVSLVVGGLGFLAWKMSKRRSLTQAAQV